MFPVLSANTLASGPYNLNNSLRFKSSASAYLSRTPASAGNRKTWTLSMWVKRGLFNSAGQDLFRSPNTNPSTGLRFTGTTVTDSTNDCIRLFFNNATSGDIQTTQVFRDPSAWYHIVALCDTTQATAANRVKLYVNGNQITALTTATYPAQNYDTDINAVALHVIGGWNGQEWLDGYLADVNFIDGQALTPSSFGSTNSTTGVWQPAKYTGTYGTNGFYLPFTDIAQTVSSNVGLGKDFSGNTNYWVTNNISTTAGTTYDAMTDVPTLTSATVANYAVMNPVDKGTSTTLADGNLTPSIASASWTTVRSTMAFPTTGKYYIEATCNMGAGSAMIGIGTAFAGLANYAGADANGWSYYASGTKYNNGSATAYGASYTTNDVIGIAFDATAGTLTFYKNNTSQGIAFSSLTSGPYFVMPSVNNCSWYMNFGQRPFTYTPPSGYVALNTYNLPDSTIVKGNTVMDATLYTGNGSTQSITNAASFKPDLVWVKGRSTQTINWHGLFDSNRGSSAGALSSNLTNGEPLETNLTSFNSNGFSFSNAGNFDNTNAVTFVGWQWQAGQGTNTSNTSGTITSSVSVNATAGFSIVTYTGTGANATVGHGLGVAPKMIITKNRGAVADWAVWHTSLTSGAYYLLLNTAAAQASGATYWNSTVPTSSVFSIGTAVPTNVVTNTYVAYCWSEISGFSKFGSYTGNASSDGPFVYCGFRPKYVLLKNASAAYNWTVWDTSRNTYNVVNNYLVPSDAGAEASNNSLDILSNGFKIRDPNIFDNGSGNTIIFAAFAENPFKNALAR